jgi:hypothetical protein
MLWTIFIMLLILWFRGSVSSYTLGGYIHILIVVALNCFGDQPCKRPERRSLRLTSAPKRQWA